MAAAGPAPRPLARSTRVRPSQLPAHTQRESTGWRPTFAFRLPPGTTPRYRRVHKPSLIPCFPYADTKWASICRPAVSPAQPVPALSHLGPIKAWLDPMQEQHPERISGTVEWPCHPHTRQRLQSQHVTAMTRGQLRFDLVWPGLGWLGSGGACGKRKAKSGERRAKSEKIKYTTAEFQINPQPYTGILGWRTGLV